MQIKYHPGADHVKGKFILFEEDRRFHTKTDRIHVPKWSPPSLGWCKLNTDGSFSTNGGTGIGMVARDHSGEIIFSACRYLPICRDALEAELRAVMEGLSLAIHWSNSNLIVEVDCLEMVKLLKNKATDRSIYSFLIEEIKQLIKVRQTFITHVTRSENTVSHFMANYARLNAYVDVWLATGPEDLVERCPNDCNLDI